MAATGIVKRLQSKLVAFFSPASLAVPGLSCRLEVSLTRGIFHRKPSRNAEGPKAGNYENHILTTLAFSLRPGG